jgi:DNA-binding NarL/FixJ family response regulator
MGQEQRFDDRPWATPGKIGVMIVEDHAIVRQGLRTVIDAQPDMRVVGETGVADDAVSLFASSKPDVVVVDLRLRNGSGLDTIRALRSRYADSRIVVLSAYSSEEHVFRAVAAGAQGYVVKSDDPAHIVSALRSAHEGHRYLSPEASARLADHVHRSSLTGREQEVLALLVRGGRNRSIAAALGIAEETVKGHVKNILGKLGVRDRAHAASEAIRRGIVDV